MASTENAPNETVKRRTFGSTLQNNPVNNPCIKEQNLSMKCLDDHNYDKDACEVYFINYKNCRAFWDSVKRERRRQGIWPHLPLPEERDEIKNRRFGSKQ